MTPVSEHPAKVATPEAAVTGLAAQARVPADVARVTEALESVTVLPLASRTVTTGWVVKATPLTAPAGWVVTANLAAAPGANVSEFVVALVRLPLVAVSV